MKTHLFSFWMVLLSMNIYADSYITLYTKCGKTIEAIILAEMSAAEIAEANSYYTSTYPNATYLASATQTYNCHSYAWNMSQGGQTCWINATVNSLNDNISKYWSRDYYSSTEESKTQKIFYYQSDHSAVVSSISGMYESKWGRAPLMRHALGYGPYSNMDKRFYCRHDVVYESLQCSNGTGTTRVGVSSTYSVKYPGDLPFGSYVLSTWIVEDGKGEDVIGTKANVTISGTIATISFNASGIYEVSYNLHLSGGEMLASYWFEPIVEL